jgi:6,7-dimethyl-8-ribityllumazine synthase
LDGTLERLNEVGMATTDITIIRVPGAVEIPLTAQLLAKTKRYAAIICLGAVIRGETNHYDYVCQQVSHGCQQVMLDSEVPIIFGVLTTDSISQAEDRVKKQKSHKGISAANTAIAMAQTVKYIKSLSMP